MRPSLIPPPVWMLIVGLAMWELNRRLPLVTVIGAPWNRLGWCVMGVAFIAPLRA